MAKRSKRNDRARYLNTPSPIASFAASVYRPLNLRPLVTFSPVLELEDRRTWHPQKFTRAALASVRSAARIIPRSPLNPPARSRAALFHAVPVGLGFQAPKKVALCVRRNTRREVLHAKRVAGSGGGFRKRRLNKFSHIGC